MIPRIKVGRGVTGAVRYVLSEGKDNTGKYRTEPKDDHSRVAWIGGQNMGFAVESAADVDLARRIMEFDALNQTSRTKKCVNDCVHISLGWRRGEEPTRDQMEEAAKQALAALGMANAKAVFVAHGDEPYAHMHIVASKLNPDTGRAYDLKGDRLTLSRWSQGYEERSGGIVCTRREEANELRDAIDNRDAAAVLRLMTKQRATFKATDLERALAKQIKKPLERAAFGETVLSQSNVVKLADEAGGRVMRYTSRAVLIAEGQVTLAAQTLSQDMRHAVSLAVQQAILAQPQFASISREQTRAVRHATGPEGLALIDGQAGTGKSFTLAAIRQAYTVADYQVIGLAPTNAVAEDMKENGFERASTIHRELFMLNNGRAQWNERTVVMVDEAAMIDTDLMAQIARRAEESKAKLILLGDDRQLSSIDRGGMFGVLKDQYGAAELSEVRRQHKEDDRRAAELMAEGNFSTALAMYQDKGAIHWQHNEDATRAALVDQWKKDSAADPSKSRFVFAYTNADVDRLNTDIRDVRKERGELGPEDHRFETKHGPADFADRDRIQFTGTDKKQCLMNGAAGIVEKIDGDKITVKLDGREGKQVEFDGKEFQDFRHGYAGTIYKGQGRTLDQTYLYHSEHWRSSSGYVALTRHRDKTEIFVARDTAEDLKELSRQMARTDDRRAASHFHQTDKPVVIERQPLPELPRPEIAARQEAPPPPRPLDWAASPGMVAQQRSATKAARRAQPAQPPADRPATQIPAEPRTGGSTPAEKKNELTEAEQRRFAQLMRGITRENDERDQERERQRDEDGRGGRGRTRR